MDTNVTGDEGAGVGKSGVQTPWETGNLGNTSDWTARPRGSSGPDAMNHNRKNKAGDGRPWDEPWKGKTTKDGTDRNQSY